MTLIAPDDIQSATDTIVIRPLTLRVISYTYDALYRLTNAAYSTGDTYQYQYDAVGNRVAYTPTVSSGLPAATAPVAMRAFSNGTLHSTSPTRLGQPTALDFRSSLTFTTYLWDFGDGQFADGTAASVTHLYTQTGTYQVVVLALNDLDAVEASTTVVVYQPRTATTYAYDAANRLTHVESPDNTLHTYAWDARGNLLSDGVWHYAYDGAGRMVQAQGPGGARGYAYNADGLRVADEQRRYVWDWATPVPELLSDGDSLYLIGYETLGWQSGAAWTYALPDALGSARQHVDATGAVAVVRAWTPYGEELGGAQVGLGFTGEWFDAAVGLTYLRARWYDGAQNNAGRAITFGCTLSCRMACDWEI